MKISLGRGPCFLNEPALQRAANEKWLGIWFWELTGRRSDVMSKVGTKPSLT